MIFPTFPKPAMWSECDKQSKFLVSRPIKNPHVKVLNMLTLSGSILDGLTGHETS